MDEYNDTASSGFPSVRIWLCGPFHMEWIDPATGHASPLTDENLHGKGVAQALSLLKLLLCQSGRQAHRDWIMEQFWPDHAQSSASHRLHNIASAFRKLLCPPDGRPLLPYISGKQESSSVYALPAYPRLWVDSDAIAWNIEQAARMERFGDNALPFWQRAFDLLKRGPFLADEPYAAWAQAKRTELEGYYRHCVHALSRLYLARYGEAGKAEVLLLLCTYLQQYKTDEDALRPLLELLGEQERYQEAKAYYQQYLLALAELGPDEDGQPRKPDPRTQDLYEYLCTKQIQRKRVLIDPMNGTENARTTVVHLPPQKLIPASPNVNLSIEQHTPLESLSPTSSPLSISPLFQTDIDVFAHLSMVLSNPSVVSEKEMIYFNQQTRLYWRAREETALPSTTLYTYVIRHIDDLTILLARSHLPRLRSSLCETVCRTVLLAGILLYDMGQYAKARQQYQVAFQAAMEANNPLLQAIVWGWMSFTWTYAKDYPNALSCVQNARSLAMQTEDIVVQAWLGAVEAEIQAHLRNRDACLLALSDMERAMEASPSQDLSYLFEFNPTLLLGYKGVCLQQFYQRQKLETHGLLQEAKEALEQALESEAPLKRKLYYLSDLAGVYARQGEVEKACAHLIQGISLIMHVGSGSKTIRKHLLQVHTLLRPYEHTSYVQTLDEQMAPLFIETRTEGA